MFYLQAIADELYDFRDHFVERFGLETAGEKDAEVYKKMEECLQRLEEIQGTFCFFFFYYFILA